MIPLQQLKAVDLKRYHDEHAQGDDALASATLEQHHTIAHSALQAAVLEGPVQRNGAKLVVGKPHASRDTARTSWSTAGRPTTFLTTAKAPRPGAQPAAF